jgi:threonyl-tRNA synthetase
MSLTDRTKKYAEKLCEKLKRSKIRAEADLRAEKIGYKIREAQLEKIPYCVIVGDKESEEKKISVRCRRDGDLGVMCYKDFVKLIKTQVKNFK